MSDRQRNPIRVRRRSVHHGEVVLDGGAYEAVPELLMRRACARRPERPT
jgi:hypothetical protein